jgi:hypothetical protein
MAELAAGGGCYPVDVQNVAAISAAMQALASDDVLLRKLAEEAISRPLTTWNDYAALTGDALAALGAPCGRREAGSHHGLVRETVELTMDGG